jgi:hypothetical protein
VAIDGKADDPAWASATPVAWTTDYAGAATGTATRARFLWSKDGLFALFELEGAGLHVDASRPTNVERKGLYNEDCVELFLGADAAHPKHYYEIELGPFGHFFDIEIDREAGKQNTEWSSGVRVAGARDAAAHRATIEAQLTSSDIQRLCVAGAELPFALYRMEGTAPRQYLAWSPPRTAKPDFHVPDAFGRIVFDR